MGILTLDLDRSVLTVRDAPKPYFTLQGETLLLHDLDLAGEDWRERLQPPRVPSYLVAFVRHQLRLTLAGRNRLGIRGRQDEKERLNRRLIHEIIEAARQRGVPLGFGLFYTPSEIRETGWREEFLRGTLDSIHVPYLDTKAVLTEGPVETGTPCRCSASRTSTSTEPAMRS